MKKVFLLFFTALLSTTAIGEVVAKFTLIVFSGSDWCKPCIRMKTESLNNTEFLNLLTAQNIDVYIADFPRKKSNKPSDEIIEKNERLANHYNQDGSFPKLVLIDAKGAVVYSKNGFVAPDVLVQELNSIFAK